MKMKQLLLVAAALLGLTAASMAQNVPSYVPGNGLVGWWPFNGNANDESGNGNNGTVNGATLTADRNGDNNTAYSFGGNTRRTIDIDIDLPYGNFTISFWFNALDTTMNALMDWRDTSNNLPVLSFNFDANYGSGFVALLRDNVNGGTVDVAPNFLPNSNEWHFITLTKNSNQLSFYINGLISLTTNYTQSIWTLNHLVLGSNYYDSTFFYTGRLDDIGIWNRALTQQEITNLYNSTNCANNTTITPQTNTITTGSTATFTATTSDPNPSYVWQSDFGQGYVTLNNYGNYSGVNTHALSISNIQLPNHTQAVRVISTSGNCIDTSNVASILVSDTCITTITDTSIVLITDTNIVIVTDTNYVTIVDTNYVTVNDTSFITVTDTLLIQTTITGINPPNNSNTLRVFPNPANDHITIDYGNFGIMNGYQLKIENSLGQQVFQTNITQQSDYIGLMNWGGNGLYFVRIINPQGNTIDIRKIVLQ